MVMISPLQNLYNLRMARALPPAGGAGLSSLPPGPEVVLPAQSPNPIDDGIKTLMAYGRQATGQGLDSLISPTGMPVRRMFDGGMADDGIGTSEAEAAEGVSSADAEAGMGVGGYSDAQAEAVTQGLAEMGIGFGADPMGVYGSTDQDALASYADAQDFSESVVGSLINALTPFSVSPNAMTMGLNVGISPAAIAGMALGIPGLGMLGNLMGVPDISLTQSVPGKGASGTTEGPDGIDVGGDGFVDSVASYGDPYNAPRKAEEETVTEEPDSFFRRQARMPLTLSDIVGYAAGQPGYTGGFPRFLPPVVAAQGGGISALAYGGDTAPTGYGNRAFEGMVPGTGTGMSDSVPFSIEGQQPALLSRDEYVLPADVVSQLGDGSSGAGADMLDNFVSQVRHSKYGQTQQPPANGGGLMSALMRHGGIV